MCKDENENENENGTEGEYTNIRIEANIDTMADDEDPTYQFFLCYTNLNGGAERMLLDAEDENNAKFEAAAHCEIEESYFDGDDKFQWD